MKIISWNCCGKFREKFSTIQKEDADIYVIQECENPEKYQNQFSEFLTDYVWHGEKNSKGLGIFVKPHIKIKLNDWPVFCLRHFISVKINDDFDLLGVWASPHYIEEYYIYQSINIDKYGENTLIIGDFNSNAIWDKEHGKRNHSAVVAELKTRNNAILLVKKKDRKLKTHFVCIDTTTNNIILTTVFSTQPESKPSKS